MAMDTPHKSPVRVNPVLRHPQEKRQSLDSRWRFRLDPEDRGVRERWFDDAATITEPIAVPGAWQGQGFGHDGTDTLFDFRYAARVFRGTYKGTGWYATNFRVPDGWRDHRVWLNFGGVHPSAEVWLNGVRLGENGEPFAPFAFEITEHIRAEGDNALAVRVHEANRDLGFSFSWQGNWSGLYRAVELTAGGASFIDALNCQGDVDTKTLRVTARIDGWDPAGGPTTMRLSVTPIGQSAAPVRVDRDVDAQTMEFHIPVTDAQLWSPEAPNLYRVDAELVRDGEVLDAISERTGFVKLSTRGAHILINDQPCYLRGSGDHAICTWSGMTEGTDREGWRRKLRTLREYGYNQVRCVGVPPTPEYLDAADEVGLLVQSEVGMLGGWAGHSSWHPYNWPYPTPACHRKIKSQWDHVILRDVNHPSANMYSMSNELAHQLLFPRLAWKCYHDTKRLKPTALVFYTDGGYMENAPHDIVVDEPADNVEYDRPIVQHEFRWWSSFPDVRIREKYSGPIRPYAIDLAIETARQHGIEHVLSKAAEMSQRLQFAEAKCKMEICRRDNGLLGLEQTGKMKVIEQDCDRLAGISHFNAMDTNASPQGIVDEFYERKYASAQQWLQTNGDCVILSSLGFEDRVLTPGDALRVRLFVSDFSHPPFQSPEIRWQLTAGPDGDRIADGQVEYTHRPFCTCVGGWIEAAIGEVSSPTKACLEAVLSEGDRTVRNRWDLWVLPKPQGLPGSVALYGECKHTWLKTLASVPAATAEDLADTGKYRVILTERLDGPATSFAKAGGRVILAASEGLVRPFSPRFGHLYGRYFFTPQANYPFFEDCHDGTIILGHPMLGNMPHEGFADLQFFRMIAESPPLELEPLGLNAADPVIRVMHSYMVGRSLGYLTEASVGAGGVVFCALGLNQAWPEARHLLTQVCRYAVGDEFGPAMALDEDALAEIAEITLLP